MTDNGNDRIVELEIERLRPFEDHPFRVEADAMMLELTESIQHYGILSPLIVRPMPEGYYEIISGHRRLHAAQNLGFRKVLILSAEFAPESGSEEIRCDEMGCDEMAGIDAYREIIAENIDKDILLFDYPYDGELIEGIADLMLEVVVSKNETTVIASNSYPTELVRSRFLKLKCEHIRYVIGCLQSNTTKVKNIKKYLLAALFNAPLTISGYYQAEVNHDMPQLAMKRHAV